MHLNYIRMINFFESHYFSLKSFPFHAIIQFWFLVYFDCIFLHCVFVVASVDYSVCTLANGLSNLIIVERTAELWYFEIWGSLRFVVKGVYLFIMLLSWIFQTVSFETLRDEIPFFFIIFIVISLFRYISFLIIST